MTSLANRTTRLRFATEDTIFAKGKQRRVVVECHTTFVRYRLQGLHDYYDAPWGAGYSGAVKNTVQAAKVAAKKARVK